MVLGAPYGQGGKVSSDLAHADRLSTCKIGLPVGQNSTRTCGDLNLVRHAEQLTDTLHHVLLHTIEI
jgi:D-ribose pyranose/furanose isomerase RbsD